MTKHSLANKQHSQTTRQLLLGLWVHISGRRRIQFALLLVLMLASGIAELVSLGAVLPFLALLSDPELLWEQQIFRDTAFRLGFTSPSELILPFTLVFVAAVVFASLIRLANVRINFLLAAAIGADLSYEAYKRSLYQPYGVHVQRNTSSVITTITTKIDGAVAALTALIQLVTSSVVAVGLFTGLLLIDAPVAIALVALFGGAYIFLAIISRRELRNNGQKIIHESSLVLKALQEGLGAIREVLLDGSQPIYLQIFRQADRPRRKLAAKNAFISAYPRFLLEALGMVAIASLGGMLVVQRGSGAAVIPLLGALALGGQRLLPALQQIYVGWAALKTHNASLQASLVVLNQPMPPVVRADAPLSFLLSIHLEKIHFRYKPQQPYILRGLDLEIHRGERIGLIGTTGSGKSTTVDLLMGLLVPTSGRVLVDGADLHDPAHPERLTAWRSSIAHVPQAIYLTDSSIAENIAFGVPAHLVDLALVKHAAEQAQVASFIESTPEGYASLVGERGILLSGGQRQRIGIARALYKNASIIVFDEATSALDSDTENAVIHAIDRLKNDLTIVIIAHRTSTLESCDRVYKIDNGKFHLVK